MHSQWMKAALIGAALSVGGCSFTDNALLPSLGGSSGSSSSSTTATKVSATTPSSTAGAPQLGTANFQPEPVAPGQPTGTAVGARIEAMRGDLTKLNASVAAQNQTLQALRAQAIQNAVAYDQAVSTINAKLEVDTTPGDPILVKQWNDAQSKLNQMNDTLSGMNKLANDVAANASMSNNLLESTRATFGMSGAVDEDHAQLRVLEDEVNKTSILIDRLLSELSEDISRQTKHLAEERANLAISGRPLVVIRFDKPNADYQKALYQAVSQTLSRRPNAAFDLVAVTPSGGGTAQTDLNSMARQDADEVMLSLIGMGLTPDRVSQSSATSAAAQVNEVRLYVR